MSASVTVVIPAHNAAVTLSATLTSAQQDPVSQIIVVDDGSSDETSALVQVQAERDERITLIRRERAGGPARARNEGLARATGEFVIFLDSDDVLLPNAVLSLLDVVTPSTSAALGRFVAVDANDEPIDIGTWANVQLQPVVRRSGRLVPLDHISGEALLTRLVVPPPGGVLIRRTVALTVGGYDESFGRSEDVAFLVALARHGELTVCPVDVLQYRRDPGQRSQATTARRRGRQRTLARVIWKAPTRAERWQLARGASAHHLDRAAVRWRAGTKGPRDTVVTLRSVTLAALFRLIGAVSCLR